MVQVMPVGIVMAVVEMEGLRLMNPTGPIVWRSGSVKLEKRYILNLRHIKLKYFNVDFKPEYQCIEHFPNDQGKSSEFQC